MRESTAAVSIVSRRTGSEPPAIARARFARQVFADRRTQHRPSVAEARERREAGALELPFEALAGRLEDLAESERAAIAQLRDVRTELMARVDRSVRRNESEARAAADQPQEFGALGLIRVEAEQFADVAIEGDQIRLSKRRRIAT